MNILCLDIGGTWSRFGHFSGTTYSTRADAVFVTETSSSNDSFTDLLQIYQQHIKSPFLDISEYDAIGLAVPGPVSQGQCQPPNVSFSIASEQVHTDKPVFMLNDFAAQAYACMFTDIRQQMDIIHEGLADTDAAIAVMGAGTGLGHCSLIPDTNDSQHYTVLASEAGHSSFSFINEEERAFESFLKQKLNIPYCVADNIVNGRGIRHLHEFLTGEILTSAEIFQNASDNQKTLSRFSRFYARAARDYCLTNMIRNCLIISGGLAAKNPDLVQNEYFREEFLHTNNRCYQPFLQQLPIYLNRDDELGLIGMHRYILGKIS